MMKTDIGEYIVGAYLKLIEKCDVIDYNVRPTGGGVKGLGELDVIGMNFKTNTVFICEVTTHLNGLLYANGNIGTVKKIQDKHQRQKEYAEEFLSHFKNKRFMFWSPRIPKGTITNGITQLTDLELIINDEYTKKVDALKALARTTTADCGNVFFRTLQILEHLR
jgi:Holliday junction resolvase-like predicted endonuclease